MSKDSQRIKQKWIHIKEDVDRKAIKDCSHFSYVPVRADAMKDTFKYGKHME